MKVRYIELLERLSGRATSAQVDAAGVPARSGS
jgi:hypothetical protein